MRNLISKIGEVLVFFWVLEQRRDWEYGDVEGAVVFRQ